MTSLPATAPPSLDSSVPRIKTEPCCQETVARRCQAVDNCENRLDQLRQRWSRLVEELCVLQHAGNVLSPPDWNRRPFCDQLGACRERWRLDSVGGETASDRAVSRISQPAVLETKPEPGLRAISCPDPGVDNALSPAPEQLDSVEWVRQEAEVKRRVLALRGQGLWSERRLPRVAEPPRRRCHWDYVLEEMQWLAADFRQERHWKLAAASRCALLVRGHLQRRKHTAHLATKRQQIQLRSIASFAAGEVLKFWNSIRCMANVRASYVTEYTLFGAVRDVISAEQSVNRHGLLERVRLLHADARLDLQQLVNSLPSGYLHERRSIAPTAADHAQCRVPPSNSASSWDSSSDDPYTSDRSSCAVAPVVSSASSDSDDCSDIDQLSDRIMSEDGDIDAPTAADMVGVDMSCLLSGQQGVEEATAVLKELCDKASRLQPSQSCNVPASGDTTLSDTDTSLLRGSLRPYQHVGRRWLLELYRNRVHALLADDSGLGRRVQTVALWAQLAVTEADWGPHLVLAPRAALLKWHAVCLQWCPSLRVCIMPDDRHTRSVQVSDDHAVHVWLVPYSTANANRVLLTQRCWCTLVVDNSTSMNVETDCDFVLDIRAKQRVLLGDAMASGDLRRLWMTAALLVGADSRCVEQVRQWLSKPVSQTAINELLTQLKEVIRCFHLARRTDKLSDQLPTVSDNVILCPLQPRQRVLYDRLMNSDLVKRALATGNFVDVMTAVKQLRCVCNHPHLAMQSIACTPFWLPPITIAVPVCSLLHQRQCPLLPCHEEGTAFAAARALSLAASQHQLESDVSAELDVLTLLIGARSSAVLSSAGGAAGQTLSRMASLTVPATVPQSRPTPAAPSPALVNSTAAPRSEAPPPTPPPSPGPPSRGEGHAAPSCSPSRFNNCVSACSSNSFDRARSLCEINRRRCEAAPVYGSDLLSVVTGLCHWPPVVAQSVDPRHSAVTSVNLPAVQPPLVVSELLMYRPTAITTGPMLQLASRNRIAHTDLSCVPPGVERHLHMLAGRHVFAALLPRPVARDCGKLRLLEQLLRQLRATQRRVLLLAQMQSVLDLLQRFVTAAGYCMIRLDASVPAHRRHALALRFNRDRQLFCALVATRTPLEPMCTLTADTVIVYDADWSPSMEALTQRRCQRTACSGPLHIYRLVSEATVESHLLQHVDETRLVRDVLVTGARGPADWRYGGATLRDLFGAGSVAPGVEGGRLGEVHATVFEDALATAVEDECDALALYTVRANRAAVAEQLEWTGCNELRVASHPVRNLRRAMECQYDQFIAELSDLQYWALDIVEGQTPSSERRSIALGTVSGYSLADTDKTTLGPALTTSEQQEQTPTQQQTELQSSTVSPPDSWRAFELGFEPLTYPCDEQMWLSSDRSCLPLWCPPTPPREDEPDQCISPQLGCLYHDTCMTESQLPPVYVRKEVPRRKPPQTVPLGAPLTPSTAVVPHPTTTSEGVTSTARAKPAKVRRDDSTSIAPRSLFNRVPSSVLRVRRELHLQQRHTLFASGAGGVGPGAQSANQLLAKSALLEYSTGDWMVHEDWSLLQALRCVLDLPLSLLAASPAHVVNWELVCELVNRAARAFRSAKFCRMRYDSVVQPREEGKMLLSSPVKKSKKHKQHQQQMMAAGGGAVTSTAAGIPGAITHTQKPIRPLRTSQMMLHDKNQAFSQLMLQRFDNIKTIASKRAPTTRPQLATAGFGQQRSPRQTSVLSEAGVDYEAPLAPAQVAANRVLRLAKEKQRLSAAAAAGSDQLTRLHKPGTGTAAAPSQAVRLQAAAVRPSGAHVSVQGATIVSVANLTPVQVAQRLVSAATAVPSSGASLKQPATIQTLTQKTLTPSQLQALKQQTVLRHKLALTTASAASGTTSATGTGTTFNPAASVGHKLQVEVSLGGAASGSTVAPIATVPNSTGQRTQVRILKQPMGKHMVAARTMTESEVAVILKQRPQLAAGVQSALVPQLLAQVQGSAPTSVTISVPRPPAAASTKSGPLAAPARPLLAHSLRKMTGSAVAPAVVGGAKRLPAQLSTVQLVQAGSVQKQLPGTVTVQQLQPVLGRVQTTGRLAGSPPRQTIQVVSAPGPSPAARQSLALTQLRPLLYTATTSCSSNAAVLVPRVQPVTAAGVARLRTAVHSPAVVASVAHTTQTQPAGTNTQTQPAGTNTQTQPAATSAVLPAANTTQLGSTNTVQSTTNTTQPAATNASQFSGTSTLQVQPVGTNPGQIQPISASSLQVQPVSASAVQTSSSSNTVQSVATNPAATSDVTPTTDV